MTRGWRLTLGLVLLLVGAGYAVGGMDGDGPDGLGVPGLLFPAAASGSGGTGDLAARAERRLRNFLSASGGADSLVLREDEVAAVSRVRLGGRLPRGVTDLRVELRGPGAVVSATVRFDRLETAAEAASRLRKILGDTARVAMEVEPSVAAPGRGRIVLRELRASGVTLPSALYPYLLSQLGVATGGGPEASFTVPLPRRVAAVRVDDGRLVLTRSR